MYPQTRNNTSKAFRKRPPNQERFDIVAGGAPYGPLAWARITDNLNSGIEERNDLPSMRFEEYPGLAPPELDR